MASLILSDLLATLKSTFRINRATVSASGLSAARTITLPDASFTVAGYVSATQRVLGRNTSGAGNHEEVTISQVLDWISATPGTTLMRGASGWEAYTVAISRTAGTTSSSGNTTAIAAQGSGNKIAVYAYALQSAGTVTAKFTDGAGGTAQTLPWLFQAREGANMPNGGQPLWIGTANTALVINLDAAVATGYEISWAVTT